MALVVALAESPEHRVDRLRPVVGGLGIVVAVRWQVRTETPAVVSPDAEVPTPALVQQQPWLHSLRRKQTWAWVQMEAGSLVLQKAAAEALLLLPRGVAWPLARVVLPFWLTHHVGCATARPACLAKLVAVLSDWRGVPWAPGAREPLLPGAGQLASPAKQAIWLKTQRGAQLEVVRPCGSHWSFLAGLFDRVPDPVFALPVPVRQCQDARANCACLGPWCCPGPSIPYAPSHILDRPQAENP